MLLILIFLSFSLKAEELVRLDGFGTSDTKTSAGLVHLYMTENCSVCNKQVGILQNCLDKERVAAYMDGKSEEKLRVYVKRKKIPFKTYLLTESAKKEFGFNDKSPALAINTKGKFVSFEGLQECDKINSAIKSDNLDPRK